MDIFDQDPNVFLDEIQTQLKSRWDKLKRKCRSLEESLKEVNAKKDELKTKLALSQEQALKSENERDELVYTLANFRQEFLKNPFLAIITKLERKISFLKEVHNPSQPYLDISNDDISAIEVASTDLIEGQTINQTAISLPKNFDSTICSLRSSDESDSNISDSKKELIVYLPRITFINESLEDSVVSTPQSEVQLENSCEEKSNLPNSSSKRNFQSKSKRCISDRECLICRHGNSQSDYVFKSYSALNQHLNEVHYDSDCSQFYFRCDFGNDTCRKYFTSQQNLMKHKYKVHSNKKFKIGKKVLGSGPVRKLKLKICPFCDESFLFLDDLQKHMKEIHNCEKMKEIKTNEDDSNFGSDDSDDTPTSCILCEEIFHSQTQLKQHSKKMHPRQFREMKKLDIDFREKPTLLPRLRRKIDTKPDISTKLSSKHKRKSEVANDLKQPKKSFSDFYEFVYGSPQESKEQLLPFAVKTEPSLV